LIAAHTFLTAWNKLYFWEKPQTVIEGNRSSWLARSLLYAGIFGCRIPHKLGTVLAFEKRNIYKKYLLRLD
jgi:hypothetical protein